MIKILFLAAIICCTSLRNVVAEAEINLNADNDLGAAAEALRTDAEVIEREQRAINLDGLNVSQYKELREKAEKHTFKAEVNRMMKLIINSLYRNKDIFLRELISNASDALDKIRLISLTSPNKSDENLNLYIKIKSDKENRVLHIYDSGVGMTRKDLINNLGTIAKSGTADFLDELQSMGEHAANDIIGQFGVGFYSAFLVADRVVVTTKHDDDKQYIWESDASSFNIVEDPEGNTLKRGTRVSLYLKEEASDFLEEDTIKALVKKYSQFIRFDIFMWSSRNVEKEVLVDESEEIDSKYNEGDVKIEDAGDKQKSKKVTSTIWDWVLLNDKKPIWTKPPSNLSKEEYIEFYKAFKNDKSEPLTYTHFTAEGEVSFTALVYVPATQPNEVLNTYGKATNNIKLYVRQVFISDDFNEFMPSYLRFIYGVIDSIDLPLNVSRETLQQHKLMKVIKQKLIRKILDMFLKLENYDEFWKEYSTNIKLGIVEDPRNRSRLAKLLRFRSSHGEGLVSLNEYIERMKGDQEHIYFIAGSSIEEVKNSPFCEKVISNGYEVLYLTEPVDEYCMSNLPEFNEKKFQNIAKEGLSLNSSDEDKQQLELLNKEFLTLLTWLKDGPLQKYIDKAIISERLQKSPCALVAGLFGWTGNMERLALSNAHKKSDDVSRTYYLNQKKTLEINPRHPLIKSLLQLVENDPKDKTAINIAKLMFHTATIRSGYMLRETVEFADSIELMMRATLGIPTDGNIDIEEQKSNLNFESENKFVSMDDEFERHDEL